MKLVLKNQKTRWWILWRLRKQDAFSSRFSLYGTDELRIFRSSPVTISSRRFRVCVSTSDCLHVRTGFIQRRTVMNEGLSGEFDSDCL